MRPADGEYDECVRADAAGEAAARVFARLVGDRGADSSAVAPASGERLALRLARGVPARQRTLIPQLGFLALKSGDPRLVGIASACAVATHGLARDRGEPPARAQLLQAGVDLAQGRAPIALKHLHALLTQPVARGRARGAWTALDGSILLESFARGAAATRHIALAVELVGRWRRHAEEHSLAGEAVRGAIAAAVLALALGELGRAREHLGEVDRVARPDAGPSVDLLGRAIERATAQALDPPSVAPTDPNGLVSLLAGLAWWPVEAAAVSMPVSVEALLALRWRLLAPATLDALDVAELARAADAYAYWQLPRPHEEVEARLARLAPAEHARRLFARSRGQHAATYLLGGTERAGSSTAAADATIVMADVQGYTRWSEGLEPNLIFQVLNPVFRILSERIESAGGMVLEFVGDCILAVFNTFAGQPRADAVGILNSVAGALREVEASNLLLDIAGLPVARLGAGVHRGAVALGAIGGTARNHLTTVGHTVNVAARLESLVRTQPAGIVVSAAALDATDGEPAPWRKPEELRVRVRRLGRLPLKNVERPPELFGVSPLLGHWISFVPMGWVASPQPGTVYLDVGSALCHGVLDNHSALSSVGSACEAVVTRPELLFDHLGPEARRGGAVEFVFHHMPDLDCAAAYYAACELLDGAPRHAALAELARYTSRVDQGYSGDPVRMVDGLHGVCLAHQILTRRRHGPSVSSYRLLEAAVRVVDAAMFIAEADGLERWNGFERIFAARPDWFAEERALLRDDRAAYDGDKSRGLVYAARVNGLDGRQPGLFLVHPRSVLFKHWARRDADAPGGDGYAFLGVDWSAPDRARFVLSVDPESGTNLRGLGEELERLETARRRVLGQPRPTEPRRHPADNADPWYFGWSHRYTIIDSPGCGTVLDRGEVIATHTEWASSDAPGDGGPPCVTASDTRS